MTSSRSRSRTPSPGASAGTGGPPPSARRIAVVGAGMAGIACARTLAQAGHAPVVFEQARRPGGRMATVESAFGGFDAGAQYFTVRDARFARALETVPGLCRPWSASTVKVLDAAGRTAAAAPPPREPHWVATPGMQSLLAAWAQPLEQAGRLLPDARVTRIGADPVQPGRWRLHTLSQDGGRQVHAGFDAVLLLIPAAQASALLQASDVAPGLAAGLHAVEAAPCWTLMVAYPHAVQPGLTTLGPQWNAARSTHHRIAWVARESSKPGRAPVERWTAQASPAWSSEHRNDAPARVQAKLLKAFAEVTGLRAAPVHAEVLYWPDAQTTRPLGRSHLWDAAAGIGLAGDWCLGHRVEDAFVAGLELALAVA
ncbi:NAD(P)-binding protein [Paracidovorax citrulli]|uniref:FAD dependent oxidoreductase n=2 Tax=Paracidovorax citrulli TaxID=80869 RepID=A1TRL0_PARC0|nr:FAD-dependent oxidoreductase [Paracidovorax citrulli]ABM33598.1 FAD dependent oxidoreductase [Paracidovorax citrulli AAC00-1]PVY63026.1 hypothetical protein C8E08_0296 [Paracidovorax citrulli]REG67991.1 hypothetical protein C8E07_1083 [Paracidovorax citrulli]RLJ92550.1 hypothetical protein C8E06_1084 [Paracidovorax citrulli]WIY31861.1 NAD(P)-binding protein [Paracidovorax citrulli]